MRIRSLTLGLGAVLAAVGIVGAACGGGNGYGNDDGGKAAASPTAEVVSSGDDGGLPAYPGAGGGSTSLIANLQLTFDGQEYRLADVQDGAAIDRSEMTSLGAGESSDVEAADMTVYRRAGDGDGVWLFVEARGEGDEAVPATWYRFSVDGAGGGGACGAEDIALC